ncbi:hypothetical protein BDZ94DRAFT_1345938 [Collybia nuda]|uniref:Uncharacterized protein n=1 Tax=Collybia nuda TaxID=64659 RepID=A0A9P5Y8H9_9AGAR|nr:hypothetical protein BDZ94DRAFT_1345938 [Collybia nuda]
MPLSGDQPVETTIRGLQTIPSEPPHHPFVYARVLGIYHANVIYVGSGMVKYTPSRMDFLFNKGKHHFNGIGHKYSWEGPQEEHLDNPLSPNFMEDFLSLSEGQLQLGTMMGAMESVGNAQPDVEGTEEGFLGEDEPELEGEDFDIFDGMEDHENENLGDDSDIGDDGDLLG